MALVRGAWEALRPFSTGGHYVNFETADEGEDRIRASYGANFARLAKVKAAYNPENLFRVNRDISPLRTAWADDSTSQLLGRSLRMRHFNALGRLFGQRMLVVQQASPGFGYFMEVLERLLPGDEFQLRRHDPTKSLVASLSDADVAILGTAAIGMEILDVASRLRLIQQHGRGVDGVDLAYATRRGIFVCNVPAENSPSVAEHAMFLILALAKKFKASQRSLREKSMGLPPTEELRGKTLGIVGLGATGKELARIAKGFGMNVLAITEHPARKSEEETRLVDSLAGEEGLDSLLRNSDFVSIHVPLNDRTRNLVDRRWFDRMKPSSHLVNVARGPIIDKQALYEALVQRKIAGAGLDVFWTYPPNPEDPLWALENVVVTPHMAGFSREVYVRMGEIVAQNIRRIARGEPPMNIVNQDILQQRLPSRSE